MFKSNVRALNTTGVPLTPPTSATDYRPGLSVIIQHSDTNPIFLGGPGGQTFTVQPNTPFPNQQPGSRRSAVCQVDKRNAESPRTLAGTGGRVMPFGIGPGGGGGVSTATQTALDAKIDKSTFDANTILKADSDDTPAALAVAASRIIGRLASGGIVAMTTAELKTLLVLAVSDTAGLQAALDAKISASLVDAAADLLVGTANDTIGRLAKGTHGQALMAGASSLAYGVPRNGNMTPADHNLICWSYDPVVASSSASPYNFNSGTARVTLLHVPYATTITNIHTYIQTAGTSITSGQSFAVLYDSAGTTQLGITADQSTAWASTGEKVMALTTPYVMVAPGYVKVLMWSVFGGAAPALARHPATAATGIVNFGMSSPVLRASTADTGLTTTAPSSIGTQTATSAIALVGLS
jgi:hypothetical protein